MSSVEGGFMRSESAYNCGVTENGSLDEAGFLASLSKFNTGKDAPAVPDRLHPVLPAQPAKPLTELFPQTALQRPPNPTRGAASGPQLPAARSRPTPEPPHPSDAPAGYEVF